MKLPEIRKWKKTLGKGIDIRKNGEINAIFQNNSIPLPSDDLERETEYKNVLKEFIRPASLMFAGQFLEVKRFAEELNSHISTDLFILSGRYGLIHSSVEIIPYYTYNESVDQIKQLDLMRHFSEKILQISTDYDVIIFLLTSGYLQYFSLNSLLEKLPINARIVVVGSKQLDISKDNRIIFLSRKGVARIGKANYNKIIEIVGLMEGEKHEKISTH